MQEQENMQEQLEGVLQRYKGEHSELIPLLQDIQQAVGYIPPEAMTATAKFLNIEESEIYGVVTFYAQFYLTPQGRRRIKVCLGTACHVRGGKRILKAVQDKLGIKPGETTEDYEFSLERVACFGSCALAPVLVIDDEVYGRMTPQRVTRLLETFE